MSNLFKPIKVGRVELAHRLVMCPLTRFRSPGHVPNDDVVEYYTQRASEPGTLIITEASIVAPFAGGYDGVPGLFTDEQFKAWGKVVEGVHSKKSILFAQLWALGRVARADVLKKAEGGPYDIVSASNIPMDRKPDLPRPLRVDEIDTYVTAYGAAARGFVEKSGGDGVEIHSANGYLLDQFLQTGSNVRTDDYGGSVENRARFVLRVIDSVTQAVGQEKVGIRFSPLGTVQSMGMDPEDTRETFSYVLDEIKRRWPNLAYVHLIGDTERLSFLLERWDKPVIIANDYIKFADIVGVDERLKAASRENTLVGIGRYFISNPDLVARVRNGWPLTPFDANIFYKGTGSGYTDYPFYTPERL